MSREVGKPVRTRPRASFTIRVLRAVYEALVVSGRLWMPIPDPSLHHPPPPRGTGPLHPERLRPDIPLSPTELALQQQLVRGRRVR
ncbi:DUF6059 family protein [Streptacidiphilus sp. P02-A3a]|uniref:DUF6059 family protein n=1 Tax=Streptacidiphilus sp. P02-A3a TaxID=2704468 RepID=UPI001CDCDB08